MSCTIEQAVEKRLIDSLKIDHKLEVTNTSLGKYRIRYSGSPLKLYNIMEKANAFVGGEIASITQDGNTTSFDLSVNVSERLANIYLSKSNGSIMEDGRILAAKQLKARRTLTPKSLLDYLKSKSAIDQKKRLVTTDLGQLSQGRIYITAGNQRQAQVLAEELRNEFGFTHDQLKVEAYDKSLKGKNSISEEAFRFKKPTEIGWRFKLGLNPADNSQFKKSELEKQAEARVLESREADYIIPFANAASNAEIDFNGFNYGNHINNKIELINRLEGFVNTLQNKGGKTATEHTQIQSVKRLITKLNKSVKAYQGTALTLQNYFETFQEDIMSLAKILERGLVEDLIVVEEYLEMLNKVTSDGTDGFLQESLDKMLKDPNISKEDKEAIDELIGVFTGNLGKLEKAYKSQRDVAIKNLLSDYIKNTSGKEIDAAELEELYTEKISDAFSDLSIFDVALNSIENTVKDKNLIGSVAHEILSRAKVKAQKVDLTGALYQIKSSIESKLKSDGDTAQSSFFGKLSTKASYQRFFRTSHNDGLSMRLASVFSDAWFSYKKAMDNIFASIENLEYKPNKTAEDYTTINARRTAAHASLTTKGHILEVMKTPEFRDDPDIAPFIPDSIPLTQDYKNDLISKIGQVEYDKLVQEQKENLYSFIAFQRNLTEEYLTRNNVANIEDLPTEEFNNFKRVIAVNTPFLNNINSTNKSLGVFKNDEGSQTQFFIPSSLKFISYTANLEHQNGLYKDEEFINDVQSDPEYYNAWKLFDEALQYINSNNNKSARDTVHNQITAQTSMMRKFLVDDQSFLGMISRRSIDWLFGLMDTSLKVATDQKINISSRVSTVENVVNSGVKSKLQIISNILGVKGNNVISSNPNTIPYLSQKFKIPAEFLADPNTTVQDAIAQYEEYIVLNSQDLDFIETLGSQIEMIEAHKAKKESEATLNFLLRKLKDQHKDGIKNPRARAIELLEFFIQKKVYDVNNMANFDTFKKGKGGHLTTLFKLESKGLMKEAQKALDILDDQIEQITAYIESTDEIDTVAITNLKELKKEAKALESFLKTNAREITAGSVLESAFLRVARFTAFWGNFGTQLGNYAMGNVSALEMDGKLWKAGNIYLAKSHTRKWKTPLTKLSSKEREIREKRDLLINRLRLFQNSANDMFNVKESRIKSTVGKVAMDGMQLPGEVEKTIQRPQVLAMLGDENLVFIMDKNGNRHPAYDFNSKDPMKAFILNGDNLGLHPDFDTPENRKTWLLNNSEQAADFFGDAGIIPKGISVVNGNYRDLSVYLAEKRLATAMLFMFKRWFAETLNKKFNAYHELYKNKHGVEATNVTMQAAILQGLNVGSFFTGPIAPIAVATLLGAKAIQETRAISKANINESKSVVRYLAERVLKALISQRFYVGAGRTFVAGNVKALQISLNSLSGRNIIDNETISKIAGYKKLEGTAEDVAKSQQELQYLMTTLALTIMMTGARLLTHALMYPDDEEEKEFNKSVRAGEGFWERFSKQPNIMAYMLFENQSQKILRDINLFSSLEGFMDVAMPFQESRTVSNWVTFINSPDMQSKNGDFKSGKNIGENRIGTAITKLFMPGTLEEGALGFASSARQDWSKKDAMDQLFSEPEKEKTPLQVYTKNWKTVREKEKERLNKRVKGLIPDEEDRKKYILKKVNKKYPSIKKYFDSDGSIRAGASSAIQRYKEKKETP